MVVTTRKRRRPSAAWPPSMGSMVPRSVISWNSSNSCSACVTSSSGPTVRTRVRGCGLPAGATGATGAAGAVAAGAATATGAGAAWPSTNARMDRSRSAVSIGSAPLPWWRASCAVNASPDCSSTSTIGGVTFSSWRRSLSSSVSIWCVSSATSVKPKVAAPPLTECAQRKIALSSSSSGDCTSSASSMRSICSRFSPASSKKTWKNWLRSMPALRLALLLVISPMAELLATR